MVSELRINDEELITDALEQTGEFVIDINYLLHTLIVDYQGKTEEELEEDSLLRYIMADAPAYEGEQIECTCLQQVCGSSHSYYFLHPEVFLPKDFDLENATKEEIEDNLKDKVEVRDTTTPITYLTTKEMYGEDAEVPEIPKV